jgi:hypothetical protein
MTNQEVLTQLKRRAEDTLYDLTYSTSSKLQELSLDLDDDLEVVYEVVVRTISKED